MFFIIINCVTLITRVCSNNNNTSTSNNNNNNGLGWLGFWNFFFLKIYYQRNYNYTSNNNSATDIENQTLVTRARGEIKNYKDGKEFIKVPKSK